MSKCVNFFRRFFLVFLTCVVTVISMAVAISPPVSAAGVFSPFNFYQLYQMLHGLLLGDGGGNSQTFGEWLEKNMTRTIGSGNDKHVFLLTPGEKLEDMMSEASIRLALGAACTDGGAAGILKMKHLMDSWNEVYDSSDIGEIGSFSGGSWSVDGWSTWDGMASFTKSFRWDAPLIFYNRGDQHVYFEFSKKYYNRLVIARYGSPDNPTISAFVYESDLWRHKGFSFFSGSDVFCFCTTSGSIYSNYPSISRSNLPLKNYNVITFDTSCFDKFCSDLGLTGTIYQSANEVCSHLNSGSPDWQPGKTGTDAFVGPVYAMPAAKQLITDTGTLSGLRLDVQTEDGTPDISAALDHAGVESVDELVAGVAAGTIPMSQVYEDMRVVPYVLTDVETGEVVTDLNVSATDAKTKAVALDKDLSIPKDVSAVDAYQVTGKTWDPSLSKYKLPLFDFFPFCLPYDAYQFLTMLDVTPVAPVFQVDTTPLFSHTKFFHASDGYKITLDLTKYEEIFQILRAGECLAIVVGLCLISYKLIHGGD